MGCSQSQERKPPLLPSTAYATHPAGGGVSRDDTLIRNVRREVITKDRAYNQNQSRALVVEEDTAESGAENDDEATTVLNNNPYRAATKFKKGSEKASPSSSASHRGGSSTSTGGLSSARGAGGGKRAGRDDSSSATSRETMRSTEDFVHRSILKNSPTHTSASFPTGRGQKSASFASSTTAISFREEKEEEPFQNAQNGSDASLSLILEEVMASPIPPPPPLKKAVGVSDNDSNNATTFFSPSGGSTSHSRAIANQRPTSATLTTSTLMRHDKEGDKGHTEDEDEDEEPSLSPHPHCGNMSLWNNHGASGAVTYHQNDTTIHLSPHQQYTKRKKMVGGDESDNCATIEMSTNSNHTAEHKRRQEGSVPYLSAAEAIAVLDRNVLLMALAIHNARQERAVKNPILCSPPPPPFNEKGKKEKATKNVTEKKLFTSTKNHKAVTASSPSATSSAVDYTYEYAYVPADQSLTTGANIEGEGWQEVTNPSRYYHKATLPFPHKTRDGAAATTTDAQGNKATAFVAHHDLRDFNAVGPSSESLLPNITCCSQPNASTSAAENEIWLSPPSSGATSASRDCGNGGIEARSNSAGPSSTTTRPSSTTASFSAGRPSSSSSSSAGRASKTRSSSVRSSASSTASSAITTRSVGKGAKTYLSANVGDTLRSQRKAMMKDRGW